MKKAHLAAAIAAALTSTFLFVPVASAQSAQAIWGDPEQGNVPSGIDRRQVMWRFEAGYRGAFVSSAGYQPFSTDDYFSQSSLVVSRTLLARGVLSFAPGFAWDYGSAAATARGDNASMNMHRLSVPLEGRAHFGPWGYAFLRAAPGVAVQHAEVDEPSSPSPLAKSAWLFSTDVSAGYAWLVWPRYEPWAREARLWFQGDAGYGWVSGDRLVMSPSQTPAGSQISAVDLGTLAMNGAFFRLSAALSF